MVFFFKALPKLFGIIFKPKESFFLFALKVRALLILDHHVILLKVIVEVLFE